MARNRRNDGSTPFAPALKALVICTLLGGASVGFVLQKNKIYELGRQMAKREAILNQLLAENKVRETKLANLMLPGSLAERVREHKLGLELPQPGQMFWLPEPEASQASPLFLRWPKGQPSTKPTPPG